MAARLRSSPFVWCALCLAVAELLADLWPPYPGLVTADAATRNLENLRGWPEYVSVDREADGPLVVLVSNSQGLAREFVDGASCYPALLGERLAAARPGARLENWSCQGLRSSELELLSLVAAERRADLLVVAVGYKNFEAPALVHLGYGGSDIDLLAGRPALWSTLLDETVTGVSTSWDDLLVRGVQLGSRLGRLRRPLLDRWGEALPETWHRTLFGHRVPTQRRLDQAADGSPRPELTDARRRQLARSDAQLVARKLGALDAQSLAAPLNVCQQVLESLVDRAASADMALLWVWVPMDVAVVPAAVLPALEAFQRRAGSVLRSHGVAVLDLFDAVPSEEFVTTAHLDLAGHARMARRLLPAVLDALP